MANILVESATLIKKSCIQWVKQCLQFANRLDHWNVQTHWKYSTMLWRDCYDEIHGITGKISGSIKDKNYSHYYRMCWTTLSYFETLRCGKCEKIYKMYEWPTDSISTSMAWHKVMRRHEERISQTCCIDLIVFFCHDLLMHNMG